MREIVDNSICYFILPRKNGKKQSARIFMCRKADLKIKVRSHLMKYIILLDAVYYTLYQARPKLLSRDQFFVTKKMRSELICPRFLWMEGVFVKSVQRVVTC